MIKEDQNSPEILANKNGALPAKTPVLSGEQKIVTSEPFARAKRGVALTRRSAVVLSLGVILVLAVLAGLWVQSHANTNTSEQATQITESRNVLVTRSAADRAASGDYVGAQLELDSDIKPTTSSKDRAILYESKSLLAYNSKMYQDGLDFAQEAERYQPTANAAYMIAMNAEAIGNKQLALDNYKKALERTPQVTRDNAPDIAATYTQKIQELSK